jgi:hypothetical protein
MSQYARGASYKTGAGLGCTYRSARVRGQISWSASSTGLPKLLLAEVSGGGSGIVAIGISMSSNPMSIAQGISKGVGRAPAAMSEGGGGGGGGSGDGGLGEVTGGNGWDWVCSGCCLCSQSKS